MRKTTLATLAAALMLAGCQVEAQAPKEAQAAPAVQAPQEPPEFNAARQAIIEQLRDPFSVRFADLVLIPGGYYFPGGDYVCGRVNAKNAFGGYTGFARFVYQTQERTVHVEPPVAPPDLDAGRSVATILMVARCPTREWCAKAEKTDDDKGGPGCAVFGARDGAR